MRQFLASSLVILLLAAAYIASPFVSAWTLRDAIKRGDAAMIEQRVAWPSVRQTLKASLAAEANLLPMANAAGADVAPTLWQRVKGMFGATMLDRFIETYVTPEGLPKLFDYRRVWREKVSGDTADAEPISKLERFKQFWARIHRAEFLTPTRVEIEMTDRAVADRRYVSVMELDGFGWKLTGLRVITVDPSKRLAELGMWAAGAR